MTNPTESKRMFEVTFSDGSTQQITVDELKSCVMGAYIEKATIGIEEGRSRRQYEQAKKSCYLTADFSGCWDLVKGMADADKKEARAIVLERIKAYIMGMEDLAAQMVSHALMKDNLDGCLRDKENPFVQNGSSLSAALEAARLKGVATGG